jgi:hypothetical protein
MSYPFPKKPNAREPIFKSTGCLVSFVVLVIYAIWAVLHPTPKPTPEQSKAQSDYLEYVRKVQTERVARETALCRSWRICREYAEARQVCAVAGNFDTCVRVKVGDQNYQEVSFCANDGSLLSPPADMPSRLQCFIHDFGG